MPHRHRYLVSPSINTLDGWTASRLAEALREPLGQLGISVECPTDEPSEELVVDDEMPLEDAAALRDRVTNIVAGVILENAVSQ